VETTGEQKSKYIKSWLSSICCL